MHVHIYIQIYVHICIYIHTGAQKHTDKHTYIHTSFYRCVRSARLVGCSRTMLLLPLSAEISGSGRH